MKRNPLIFVIVCAFIWSSCLKTEIKPNNHLTNQPTLSSSSPIEGDALNVTFYVASGPLNLTGEHNIRISGKSINGGTVPAITLTNCYNVHITQNKLSNSTSSGVYLINCNNITIDYNYISNVSTGVNVENSSNGGIVVNNNEFLNMNGPFSHGQFVQFSNINGSNNSISYNRCENIFGQSTPEQSISIYKCNGTAASPIKVNGNCIRGGGPSLAGGGIVLGNRGGSYQVASNNILVDPGQFGMAIAGGDHISLTNNSIYAKAQSFTNVGIYIWAQGVSACTNTMISGNKVNFRNAANAENDSWIGNGESTPAGWATNTWGANINASILPPVLVSLTAAGAPISNLVYTPTDAINLNGVHDITISGKFINGGSVPAITLTNCYNVHITQNLLKNSVTVGVYLVNCKDITVDYNHIVNVSTGVYVENTTGGGIIVNYNQFKNMKGPLPRGQFVQFNTVSGANNSISYNKGENYLDHSYPEDAINLYMSNGTADSPIKVIGNWIRGGGPSATGGGIMLGDNGGSYEIAADNILVDPGQYGMAIAGGDNISITNNSLYAKAQSFTNVGIYIWGQSGYSCSNATISGNKVNFKNTQYNENDSWIGTGESNPAGWDTNVWGANIDASILPSAVVSF